MQIIAKQVDPEYQDSNFDFDFYEGIIIDGNRDYISHTTPEYDLIIKYIGNAAYDWDNHTNKGEKISEILRGYGFNNPTGKNWSKIKLHQWREIFEADDPEDDENIIKALNLLTGGNWEYTEIRGYCQGDWQGVYYDSNKWTNENLRFFEITYFNLGSEYECYPADDPEDTIYIYVYDDARAEISDYYGVKPDEVNIYQFARYTKTPKYKLLED